ncbi:MAG: biotin--[acetyl-CoA-carboxylase] ligase [Candidatus Omnitrophota bacterium]
MRDKILGFLRKRQDYISGDYISHRLGISRQALWKHVQDLRDSGYEIVAVPHLGYKLTAVPDRLFISEVSNRLNTRFVGRNIYYFDSVISTMDIALQLGLKNCPEGTVIIAETQTKGRGRIGRQWFSPRYKGIYFSCILRPKILPYATPVLTLLTAVSICEAIKNMLSLDVQIKWPNDILLHNKKLGGILTELNAEMDEVRFIVIGVGLNVNNDKRSLVEGATSLKEHIQENINRVELLQEIMQRLEGNYILFQEKGSHAIIEKWRHYNITLGRRVRVLHNKEYIEGEASDIDSDGSLLLRKDSGLVHKITSGDITHCR